MVMVCLKDSFTLQMRMILNWNDASISSHPTNQHEQLRFFVF